ncbi:fructose-1 [Peptococcaceae bacterium DYL19]|nr:fructose-1 [Phosphitispora fastidiosa]
MDLKLEKIINAVISAGKIVSSSIGDEKLIKEKSYANYVTNIDLQVSDYLTGFLMKEGFTNQVITEENEVTQFDFSEPVWILDPIDGTTNLVHDYPHLAISLAFYDRKGIFGVIYNPITEELFHAESGKGAYLNGKKIKVSNNAYLKDSLIGFGFPYNR